jgi:hypothetical protein
MTAQAATLIQRLFRGVIADQSRVFYNLNLTFDGILHEPSRRG